MFIRVVAVKRNCDWLPVTFFFFYSKIWTQLVASCSFLWDCFFTGGPIKHTVEEPLHFFYFNNINLSVSKSDFSFLLWSKFLGMYQYPIQGLTYSLKVEGRSCQAALINCVIICVKFYKLYEYWSLYPTTVWLGLHYLLEEKEWRVFHRLTKFPS